jgi:hypothetical protein
VRGGIRVKVKVGGKKGGREVRVVVGEGLGVFRVECGWGWRILFGIFVGGDFLREG